MKKFLIPLFLVLLLSCSNEDIKPSGAAASEQKNNRCSVYHNGVCDLYKSISENLCREMGGEVGGYCPVDDSSSSDEISSSSRNAGSSSSRSSSSRASSSSVGALSSSSGGVVGSSSSGDAISSSSGGVGSSSSGGAVSSSSGGAGSSSSIGNSSSSSVVISSSSSAPPGLACSAFPYYYVAKTKKEYIKDLVPSNGCGNVTYTVPSGGGSSYASIDGDSISFDKATASSTPRDITIRATASQCSPATKDCTITVVIADDYRDARCNHQDIFDVNLSNIKSATTVIEYACCESKSDYLLTCANMAYNLKVKSSTNPVTSSGGNANLPNITPIPENNALCDVQKGDPPYYPNPKGILYHYPERVLMTVTNTIPTGGFSCNSW